jgi:multicomponent Na+:H+ antiporter subunit A
VGYGMALLFVLQGAPDLALTQLLIETLTLVLFVLVLRHLPEHFQPVPWRAGKATRRIVAGAVGLFMFAFVLQAGAARVAPAVSDAYLADAVDEAGGANVVNVILVDFRSLDTLGEVTVLVVAALGVAALVRVRRARQQAEEERP